MSSLFFEPGARLTLAAGDDAQAPFRLLERLGRHGGGSLGPGDYLGSPPPVNERIASLRARLGCPAVSGEEH
jgi:hypothetical protein